MHENCVRRKRRTRRFRSPARNPARGISQSAATFAGNTSPVRISAVPNARERDIADASPSHAYPQSGQTSPLTWRAFLRLAGTFIRTVIAVAKQRGDTLPAFCLFALRPGAASAANARRFTSSPAYAAAVVSQASSRAVVHPVYAAAGAAVPSLWMALPSALLAAARARAAPGRQLRLHDLQALAEPLIMYHLALAQEVQRLDDLRIVGHVHQVLVRYARLLLRCNDTKTEKADKQAAAASKKPDFIGSFRFWGICEM